MSSKRIAKCKICGRQTNNAYICRRCGIETHDLLAGGREPDSQPGIAWYVKRLRESAYGQTRLGRSLSARTSSTGYALLGNQRAADLLVKINAALARWEAIVMRLRATHRHENGWLHMGQPTRDSERLEVKRARFIAANTVLLRHHCASVNRLHAEMLDYARQAWRIINRPNDICCGACPNTITEEGVEKPCGTLLYAEEGSNKVQCGACRAVHDVETLRDGLKDAVTDMLFTRAELVKLMETRLNDRIPQPTFTKLLRDGRLAPRKIEDGIPMFTYEDVCEARLKPVPHKKIREVS